MKRRLFTAVMLALAAPLPGLAAPAPSADMLTRRIAQGDVRGVEARNGTRGWFGIPFAAPPVDDLRWKAPRSPASWPGVRDGTRFGAPCPQMDMMGAVTGQEDCLTLNVWAPVGSSAKSGLPVMVWLHGGGNRNGSGALYDGSLLAASQNVVVVTINYRLGVLGWLSHPALVDDRADALDRSGNFGTLDMVQALRWVKSNIGALGGDPRRVTLFGESAGATHAYALLASPPAKGLFHRAIVQSGWIDSTLVARAQALNDAGGSVRSAPEILLRLLIDARKAGTRAEALALVQAMPRREIAAFWRSRSYSQLSAAIEALPFGDRTSAAETPVPYLFEDGTVLPSTGVAKALADGNFARVPIILGGTRDDGGIMLAFSPRFVSFSSTGLVPKDPGYFLIARDYASRLMKAVFVDGAAQTLSRYAPGRIFAYRFDWSLREPSLLFPDVAPGAAHGLDLLALFGKDNVGIPQLHTPEIDARQAEYAALNRMMMDYWGEFARMGVPRSPAGRARWAPWRTSGSTMLLDSRVMMENGTETLDRIMDDLAADRRLADDAQRCALVHDLSALPGTPLDSRSRPLFEARFCQFLQSGR
jgi:para-nitrobenzyl esterase